MVAEPQAYLTLFPIVQQQTEKTLPVLRAELTKKAIFSWNDPPLDPSWTKPDPALVGRIESAHGLLDERFAFCQTMPMDEFRATAEGLRPSGYRPVRFRPYADAGQSCAWPRSGLETGRVGGRGSGLSSEQVHQQDKTNRSEKIVPVDVAACVTTGDKGNPIDSYAALWVEAPGDDARMYVAATADDETEIHAGLKELALIPRTLHAMQGSDASLSRYCGVLGPAPLGWCHRPCRPRTVRGELRGDPEQSGEIRCYSRCSDQLGKPADDNSASVPRLPCSAREKTLTTKPANLRRGVRARAMANLSLGETAKVLGDFDVLIGTDKDDVEALLYRAIALRSAWPK